MSERITPRQLQQLAENIEPDTGTAPVDLVWIELLVSEVRRLRALIAGRSGDGPTWCGGMFGDGPHADNCKHALEAEARAILKEQD